MKIKSKLILAATSLLVLSGVAAGTSTYAWYTANRTVSLSATTINATAAISDLSIKYYDVADDTESANSFNDRNVATDHGSAETTGANSALTFDNKLTDVSGQGNEVSGSAHFVKPIFGADDSSAITNMVGEWGEESIYQASHPGISYYHEFTYTFVVTGTVPVALYLTSNNLLTYATEVGDGNTLSANSVRISTVVDEVLDADQTTPGTLEDHSGQDYYINPNSDSTGTNEANTYLTYSDPTFTSNSVTSNILDTGFFTKNHSFTESELYQGAGPSTLLKYTDPSTGYLATLTPTDGDDDSVNITFKTWIEGTDAQTTASSDDLAATFAIGLGFYTLTIGTIQSIPSL